MEDGKGVEEAMMDFDETLNQDIMEDFHGLPTARFRI